MSDLKSSITILVLYITIVLGIANIDSFQSSVIDFSPEFFILVAIIVFSELMITGGLIRKGVKISYYAIIIFWVIVYLMTWLLYFRDNKPIQVQIIQLLLVAISAGLAYDVGKRIGQLDRILDGLSSSAYPNRAREIHESLDLIAAEITRSRRYHHPLSVLVFQLYGQKNKEERKAYTTLENDMRERFAVAKISQILSDLARNTDVILRDKGGVFVLICPETDANKISILAERIVAAVDESLDSIVGWGSATFPDEAITFDDLLQVARKRLVEQSSIK